MVVPRRSYRMLYRTSNASSRAGLSASRVNHGTFKPDPGGPHGRRRPLSKVPDRATLLALVGEIEADRKHPPTVVAPEVRDATGAKLRTPAGPTCPECGITPPGRPRADGLPRRHRTVVDDPTAPWCAASPPRGKQ